LFTAAIAAVEIPGDLSLEGAIELLAVGFQTYAEIVATFSAFILLLIIFAVEYAARNSDEPRQPQAFWQGISLVAACSGVVAATNIASYLFIAMIDTESGSWRLSAVTLTFLLVSAAALIAAVRARACANRALA
jgi:hypothetical protein